MLKDSSSEINPSLSRRDFLKDIGRKGAALGVASLPKDLLPPSENHTELKLPQGGLVMLMGMGEYFFIIALLSIMLKKII